jgi:hypothetical protein
MACIKRKIEGATIKLMLEVRRTWEAAATAECRLSANPFEVALLDYVQNHPIDVSALTRAVEDRERS